MMTCVAFTEQCLDVVREKKCFSVDDQRLGSRQATWTLHTSCPGRVLPG